MFGLPVFDLLPSNPESYYTPALLFFAAVLMTIPYMLISLSKWTKGVIWTTIALIMAVCVAEGQLMPTEVPAIDIARMIIYPVVCFVVTFVAVHSFPIKFLWSRCPMQVPGGIKAIIAFWLYAGSAGLLITAYYSASEIMTVAKWHFTPEMLIGLQKYGSAIASSALTGLIVTVALLAAVRIIRKVYSKISGSRIGRWIGIAKTWVGCKAVDAWHWLRARFASLRRSTP